jgi:centrosomal protein CEP350
MIQIETNKSDQLGSLIKMREKALLDRTKGQIAWLELQKQRFKTKGMPLQISAIKKKQRAVLVRLQKEREEIQR